MHTNQVITKSYPENLNGGFMICGINYGYSIHDEENEKNGIAKDIESPSFFSDSTVRKSDRFRNRVLKWLKGWGLEFETIPGSERAFERSFFQCNWLDSQTRSINSDGKIDNQTLVIESEGFLNLLLERKPSVIFLFGAKLLEALNDERVKPKIIEIFGDRTFSNSYTAEIPNYNGKIFSVRVQKFGETVVIASPHPQARGLSDIYMSSIKLPIFATEKLFSKCFNVQFSFPTEDDISTTGEILSGLQDPLFDEAKSTFTLDQEMPISFLQKKFRIGYIRAKLLHMALTN